MNGLQTTKMLRRASRMNGKGAAQRARQYRDRAEEILSAAENVRFAETRLTLISLAESYQHMALALEHADAAAEPKR
jgi:hypothetical protein